MSTHRRICLSLAAAATLLSGCDTDETFSDTSEFTPRAGLSGALVSEIKNATASFEAAMTGAYVLPKPKGCQVIENYGDLLQDYLVAAAQHDTKQTSESLHSIHQHLRCATAREFAMFYRALHSSVLVNAYDKDQPVLRDVDELTVPLAVLLQDMGARGISSELGVWLHLRGEPIRARSEEKNAVLADLDIVVPHGLTTRRVGESEKIRVYDAIADSSILGPCATSELIRPDGMSPICPQDCSDIPMANLDPKLSEDLLAACKEARELLAPQESQPVKDAMFACVEEYKAATSQDGFAACVTTRFRGLSEDDLSLGGSTQVHISKQCQLSQDSQPAMSAEERQALIEAKKALIARLLKDLAKLDAEIIGINLNPESGSRDFLRIEWQLEPNAERLIERIVEAEEEIDDLNEGGEGTQRCSQDSDACSDSCDVQSQVQQLTQDCLEETEQADQPSNPDPIDPLGPEVDPDSPLGELMECISKAAVGEEASSQESCEAQLTCADGEVGVEFYGLCVCEVAHTQLAPSAQCSWQIGCAEDPCDCDGAPLSGDPIPRPEEPFLLFEFRR